VNSAKTLDSIVIEPLAIGDFERFIAYLNEHLAENGSGEVGYFQPMSREAPTLPLAKTEAFRVGLGTAVPEFGWRRAWVARERGAFVGHVDLRARPEPFTSHRCLLGMGVHHEFRRGGLAGRLLAVATAWAVETSALDWIDLEVLSTNVLAVRLYEKTGFELAGELTDLFRTSAALRTMRDGRLVARGGSRLNPHKESYLSKRPLQRGNGSVALLPTVRR
jgi:ribosomal protein S18 acetylase RimI-like enzyme